MTGSVMFRVKTVRAANGASATLIRGDAYEVLPLLYAEGAARLRDLLADGGLDPASESASARPSFVPRIKSGAPSAAPQDERPPECSEARPTGRPQPPARQRQTAAEDLTQQICCVTDPPYEFDASGGGKMRRARPYLDLIEREGLSDGFDDSILSPELFGAVVVFCHERQIAGLKGALDQRFGRSSLLAWEKENPPPWANKSYLADVEFYLHAWTDGHHPCGEHGEKRRVFRGKTGKSAFDHPTVKPLALMRKILSNVAAPVIVDPFMGTGTTGIAALEAGREGGLTDSPRRFIGIERNETWFEIAVARLKDAAAQGALELEGAR